MPARRRPLALAPRGFGLTLSGAHAAGLSAVLLIASVAAAVDRAAVERLHALVGGVEQEYREAFDASGRVVRPFELEEAGLLLHEARAREREIAAAGGPDLQSGLDVVAAGLEARIQAAEFSTRVRALHEALEKATGIGPNVFPRLPPSAVRGAPLFETHCVRCHGATGKGDGPDAARAGPRPADFTDPAFMNAETPADFFLVISLGRRRAAMPGFEDVLSTEERWDLVSHVWSLRDAYRRIDAGRRLFVTHCASCHAAGAVDGRAARARDSPSARTPASSLAALERMALRTDADIDAAIADGTGESGMPAFRSVLTEDEIRAVGAFARTLSLGSADAAAAAQSIERGIDLVAAKLSAAVDAHRLREDGATGLAAEAYLIFEPLEPAIATRDADAVARVEREFARLQQALREPDAVREVDDAAAAVSSALAAAREVAAGAPAPGDAQPRATTGMVALMIVLAALLALTVRHWRK